MVSGFVSPAALSLRTILFRLVPRCLRLPPLLSRLESSRWLVPISRGWDPNVLRVSIASGCLLRSNGLSIRQRAISSQS